MSPNHLYSTTDLDTVLDSVDDNQLIVLQVKSAWCTQSLSNEAERFQLSLRYRKVATFYKVHSEVSPKLTAALKPQTLPTMIFIKNKIIVRRLAGCDPVEVETALQLLSDTAAENHRSSQSTAEESSSTPNPTLETGSNRDKKDAGTGKSSSSNLLGLLRGWPSSWANKKGTKRKAEEDAGSKEDDEAKAPNPISPNPELGPSKSLEEAIGLLPYASTTVIKIEVADGSKLKAHLNLNMPVSKIREVILLQKPEYSKRSFELVGPPCVGSIKDESATIEDSKLKDATIRMRIVVSKK